jgi:hypothetical protein
MSQRRDRGYRFLSADVDRHGNVRIYFRRKGHGCRRWRRALMTDGVHTISVAIPAQQNA